MTHAKMSGWTLIYIDNWTCDLCARPAAVNVYRRPLSCECNKCKANHRSKYEFFHVCGLCFTQWAKTNSQYLELD